MVFCSSSHEAGGCKPSPRTGVFLIKAVSVTLDLKQVAERYHVKPSAIVTRVKRAKIPRPISGKGEKLVWRLDHLEEWEHSHSKDAVSKRIDNVVSMTAKREMQMHIDRERLAKFGIRWTTCPVDSTGSTDFS
jgi:predicted DNA-binding transcriptional regulator AlpA